MAPATPNDVPRLAVKRELIKNGLLVKPGSREADVRVWWVIPPACWSSWEMALPRLLAFILHTLHFSIPAGFLARILKLKCRQSSYHERNCSVNLRNKDV